MTLRIKRWVTQLHFLAIALLIGALFVVPITVRADGDPPPVSGPFIDYQQVSVTVDQQWPAAPGGMMVLKVKVADKDQPPPPGYLIVQPLWPRNADDTVIPGAAAATGSQLKFWPTYTNGDAWVIVPIPDDLSATSPITVGVQLDFAALVNRGRALPVLYYWGNTVHEQTLTVLGG
jgi:hypothetical protein